MTAHMDTDKAISAAVRALAAGRGVSHVGVAEATGIAEATFKRRLAKGGWAASEVVKLAEFFQVPVESMLNALDGQVAPVES